MITPEHMRACPGCGSTSYKTKNIEPPFQIVQCRECHLVYLANPPDQSTLYEEYYAASDFAPEEYSRNSSIPALAEMYAINAQRLRWIQKFKVKGRLLDIGCGRGYFLKSAQERGFEAAGIEISARAVEFARHGMQVKAEAKTLEQMQNRSEKFDVITLWHVLEHFHDPFEELQRVRQVLADRGVCFVEVPNWRSLKFILSRDKWQGGNHPRYHRTFFTAQTLAQALRQGGFSHVQRLKLSYRLPEHSTLSWWLIKRVCNAFGVDAFLAFAASK